jgi:hypothetical protein
LTNILIKTISCKSLRARKPKNRRVKTALVIRGRGTLTFNKNSSVASVLASDVVASGFGLNWMRITLGEYHPESGQCFGTDMVFKIYILLNFTLLNIVIIIKTNAHLSSISNFNFRRCMLSCLGPRGVLSPVEFKIIWILTVRLPDKYFCNLINLWILIPPLVDSNSFYYTGRVSGKIFIR